MDEASALMEQLATQNSPAPAPSLHLILKGSCNVALSIANAFLDLATAVKATEKFSEILQVASELSVSLGHCVGLVAVQEEVTLSDTVVFRRLRFYVVA